MGQQVGCAGEVAGGGGTASRKGMKCELEAQLLLVSSGFLLQNGGVGGGKSGGGGAGGGARSPGSPRC